MTSGGWVARRKVSAAERKAVTTVLDNTKDARFRDPNNRETFFRCLKGILSRYDTIEFGDATATHDALTDAAKAAEKLEKALARLGDEDPYYLDALAQEIHIGNEQSIARNQPLPPTIKDLRALAHKISRAASKDADMLKQALSQLKNRGWKDRTKSKWIASQLAVAWRSSFGIEPSPGREGPFANVLNALLCTLKEKTISEAALKDVLSAN